MSETTRYDELERRLANIEQRLDQMEFTAQVLPKKHSDPRPSVAQVTQALGENPFVHPEPKVGLNNPAVSSRSIVHALGIGGSVALIIAAAYLVTAVISLNWLTAERQLGLALVLGGGLIVTGLALKANDRRYFSMLPAAGVVILFISIFVAHTYYNLIGAGPALLGVMLVAGISLWLCHEFHSDLYALLAVIFTFLTPMIVSGPFQVASDVALYFLVWSLLFSAFAIYVQNRSVYLTSMYLGIISFSYLVPVTAENWGMVAGFQSVQFLVFLVVTVSYSVIHRSHLSVVEGWCHFPGLLLFYALQSRVLSIYMSNWAPWMAITTVAVLVLAYLVAQNLLQRDLRASAGIISGYASIVFIDVLYLELIPYGLRPWVGLALALALFTPMVFARQSRLELTRLKPHLLAMALALLIVCFHVASLIVQAEVSASLETLILYLGYTSLAYASWYLSTRLEFSFKKELGLALLGVGQLLFLSAVILFAGSALEQTIGWATLAVVTLLLAMRLEEITLAKSALFILGLTTLKVVVIELNTLSPLSLIISLFVLAFSLFLSGWLYHRLTKRLGGSDLAAQAAKSS